MKIAIAQQNYHIANFGFNTGKIIDAISKSREEGAELVIFSELSVCGYPARDFVEFKDFINRCYEAVDEISRHTEDIGVIIGAPERNPLAEGKDLFNSAWLLYQGKVQAITRKSLLPNYDVFDEYRYFEPAYEWQVVEFKGKRLAITVCEDLWNLGDNPLYRICPMDQLIRQGADLMINISASPFDYDHDDDRKEVVRANVLKYKIPIYYCNAVGAQTELIFDGGSLVVNDAGEIVEEMNYFEEDFRIVDSRSLYVSAQGQAASTGKNLDRDMRVAKLKDASQLLDYLCSEGNLEQIRKAIVLGIRDYFYKQGFTKAIIASSGGIDSAVTLVLACEALGAENVMAVLMPSAFSTNHSVTDAELLSQNLNNPYEIIPIGTSYDSLLQALQPVFDDLPFDVAEENLQSRIRGTLVMAMANKFGYILLNTSNKSELATGYGTLYGDMAGGISILGDVYKMQVYALARQLNKNREIIPVNIINKAPSAELRPGQQDSDSLPDYRLLDPILYQYIEGRKSPSEIIAGGADEALVNRIMKMVNTNEYKRNQFCPIIRVSAKAFGVGRRMPIVGKYL